MNKSADIAILNCIPLDEIDWHKRAEATPCGDFVRFLSETRFNGNISNAWDFFQSEAAFIKEKLEKFETRGNLVKYKATTDDIQDAAKCMNVVLIAHWKGPRVLIKDIIHPIDLLKFLFEKNIIKQSFSSLINDIPIQLRNVLMEFIIYGTENQTGADAHGDIKEDNINTIDQIDKQYKLIERRERLNEIPVLIQGNRLEAWDAMLSAEAFSKLFAPSFNGTVYMIVCTSNYMTEIFRRQHKDAICICSRNPVSAGLDLAKLDAAFKIMDDKKIQLWRALQVVGEMIDSIAKKGGFSR